ncbi:MAG TPA: hypothetical protein DCE78_08970 [Bacteroidetes bacterium]|nr:hypothetical protein [Bacteroidota bacterium]
MKKQFSNFTLSIVVAGLAVIFTGCGIPSVHPLFESTDLVNDEQIQGVWVRSDNTIKFHVMRVGDLRDQLQAKKDSLANSGGSDSDGNVDEDFGAIEYLDDLISRDLGNLYFIQNEEEPEEFYLAGLVEIGGELYFDFFKVDFELSKFSYPVHLFMKVSIASDELIMHMFSEEWLKEQIKNRQIRIQLEVNQDDNYLLTAPTRDLKKFVEKYGSIEDAYRHQYTYRKVGIEPRFVFEEPDIEEEG